MKEVHVYWYPDTWRKYTRLFVSRNLNEMHLFKKRERNTCECVYPVTSSSTCFYVFWDMWRKYMCMCYQICERNRHGHAFKHMVKIHLHVYISYMIGIQIYKIITCACVSRIEWVNMVSIFISNFPLPLLCLRPLSLVSSNPFNPFNAYFISRVS